MTRVRIKGCAGLLKEAEHFFEFACRNLALIALAWQANLRILPPELLVALPAAFARRYRDAWSPPA